MMDQLKKFYKKNPKEIWYRGLSYVLSIIFIPNITVLLFLVYMAEYNFFSYDFFSEGIFGMKLFVLTSVLVMVMISFFSVGFLFYLFTKKGNGKIDWKTGGIVLFLNLVVLCYMIFTMVKGGDAGWILFLIFYSVIIVFHISMLLSRPAKIQLFSLALLAFMSVMLTLNRPVEASRFLSIGLKAYGIGGDIPCQIVFTDNSVKKGKLKLMTPNSIYFVPDNIKGITSVSRSSILEINIGGKYD